LNHQKIISLTTQSTLSHTTLQHRCRVADCLDLEGPAREIIYGRESRSLMGISGLPSLWPFGSFKSITGKNEEGGITTCQDFLKPEICHYYSNLRLNNYPVMIDSLNPRRNWNTLWEFLFAFIEPNVTPILKSYCVEDLNSIALKRVIDSFNLDRMTPIVKEIPLLAFYQFLIELFKVPLPCEIGFWMGEEDESTQDQCLKTLKEVLQKEDSSGKGFGGAGFGHEMLNPKYLESCFLPHKVSEYIGQTNYRFFIYMISRNTLFGGVRTDVYQEHEYFMNGFSKSHQNLVLSEHWFESLASTWKKRCPKHPLTQTVYHANRLVRVTLSALRRVQNDILPLELTSWTEKLEGTINAFLDSLGCEEKSLKEFDVLRSICISIIIASSIFSPKRFDTNKVMNLIIAQFKIPGIGNIPTQTHILPWGATAHTVSLEILNQFRLHEQKLSSTRPKTSLNTYFELNYIQTLYDKSDETNSRPPLSYYFLDPSPSQQYTPDYKDYSVSEISNSIRGYIELEPTTAYVILDLSSTPGDVLPQIVKEFHHELKEGRLIILAISSLIKQSNPFKSHSGGVLQLIGNLLDTEKQIVEKVLTHNSISLSNLLLIMADQIPHRFTDATMDKKRQNAESFVTLWNSLPTPSEDVVSVSVRSFFVNIVLSKTKRIGEIQRLISDINDPQSDLNKGELKFAELFGFGFTNDWPVKRIVCSSPIHYMTKNHDYLLRMEMPESIISSKQMTDCVEKVHAAIFRANSQQAFQAGG
jgi:hypothetical protein